MADSESTPVRHNINKEFIFISARGVAQSAGYGKARHVLDGNAKKSRNFLEDRVKIRF